MTPPRRPEDADRRRGAPPSGDSGPEEVEFEVPSGLEAIPLAAGGAGVPDGHVSFNAFWAALGLPDTPENHRLRELFYEWLGQRGYDVHDRNEPTILGDESGFRLAWARYLQHRRLS